MGNITSRQATNLLDGFVLRLARLLDSTLRRINRTLSTLSSLFFSKVFGYDVVIVNGGGGGGGGRGDASADLVRKDSLVCGPGNVCIVPASRMQQRQVEKKRRSERRRRAEAAAMGERVMRQQRGYALVESAETSPIAAPDEMRERVRQSLGEVARAPPARSEAERETVAERERGKLWVMGNMAPSSSRERRGGGKRDPPTSPSSSSSSSSPIDHHVLQRVQEQRSHMASDSTVVKRRIQPRKSSRPRQHRPFSGVDPISLPVVARGSIAPPVMEADQTSVARQKRALASTPQPIVLPEGALSLGASPWQPTFRHPFSVDHEPLATADGAAAAPPSTRPRLSIETHRLDRPSVPPLVAWPVSITHDHRHGDDAAGGGGGDESLAQIGTSISRPPSSASHRRRTVLPHRPSIDALSLARSSLDSSISPPMSAHPPTNIDVKTLATQAVREEKGRKVWKDHVNKAALHRCLLQQQQQPPPTAAAARRFSAAAAAGGHALTRVRTTDSDATALVVGRRGSSPALGVCVKGPALLRGESPLHAVVR